MDAVEVAPEPDVSPDTVRAAMSDVDTLGGFFAVAVGPAPTGERWRPLAELYGPVGPGDVLDARIGEVAGQLGASRRVAASLLGLSLTARATAVVLATVVEHGVLPLLPDDRLCWHPWPGGPLPLWIADPAGHAVGAPDDGATADVVAAELGRVHLRPLVAAIRARASVSEQVLWGNAASSLAGAVRVLALERPHARDAARVLAEGLLARLPFAGLGAFVPEPSHPTGFGFLRTTCCLFHRVPGGGTCGDCVLGG